MYDTYLIMFLSFIWGILVGTFRYRFAVKCVLALVGAVLVNLIIHNLANLGG